jgi:murein DD-endopeptidase MepM/ murein hydrolase activator NlpD
LGRFTQPDTIVPISQGTQAWDRFAYVNNNPLRYTDPTGHGAYCGDDYDPGCLNDEETYHYNLATKQPLRFENLPVAEEDLEWIQWFGGTESAYNDHLAYQRDPDDSYKYDAYCQGYHCGIDFGAAWGDPVYAGVYGQVIKAGPGSGGYEIVIQVGDYQILYQAVDGDFLVKDRQFVSPDTVIAGVGNHSADPQGGNVHLHLEVRYSSSGHAPWKDRIANPLLFMDMSMYEQLKSREPYSPYNNINFHVSERDPLKQLSPIIRGGGVLWDD